MYGLLILSVPVMRCKYRKKTGDIEKSHFSELFEGIKKKRHIQSSYMMVFMLRRLFTGIFIFAFNDAHFYLRMSFFGGVQVANFIYLVIVRPIDSVKDFLIELLNEIVFLVLIAFVLFNGKESDSWSEKQVESV